MLSRIESFLYICELLDGVIPYILGYGIPKILLVCEGKHLKKPCSLYLTGKGTIPTLRSWTRLYG